MHETQRFCVLVLFLAMGFALQSMPRDSAAQAAMGVAGNEIQVAFQGLATVNSLIQAKKAALDRRHHAAAHAAVRRGSRGE